MQYNNEDMPSSNTNDNPQQDNVDQQMSNDFMALKESVVTSSSFGSGFDINTEQDNMAYYTAINQDVEQLCAGEVLDDNSTMLDMTDEQDTNKDAQAENTPQTTMNTMNWSEKKGQFSMMKYQSEDSLSSELSSISRHSFSSYLHARECDAEEILLRLGFGSLESSMNIPTRFLDKAILDPSHLASATNQMVKADNTDDDVFADVTSRTSHESSWSDSSLERLPSRFTSSNSVLSSSASRGNSVSSLSDLDDDYEQPSAIPSIVEPEKEQVDGFDLMRHLRLHRGHHDKGFLEPVKEELEVSSISSGSARTKVAAQQDSFDSVGNLSVVTKILASKEDTEDLKESHKDQKDLLLAENINNGSLTENICESERLKNSVNGAENESVDNLRIPSLNSLALRIPQESFELEEIATSEENLDKIEDNRSAIHVRTKRYLRRDHSDDSSGFEDDANEFSMKTSNFDSMEDGATKSENISVEQGNSLFLEVPLEVSTPCKDADSRRTMFAKRHSWSTSRQKHVTFEGPASHTSRSFEDTSCTSTSLRTANVTSHSLDIHLPLPNKTSLDSSKITSIDDSVPNHLSTAANENDITVDDNDVHVCLDSLISENHSEATEDDELNTRTKTSKNTAIRNIKDFMSSLFSIRSKLKKNPIVESPEILQDKPKDNQMETNILEKEVDNVAAECSAQQKTKTDETRLQIYTPPSVTVTSVQSNYDLPSFEKDLRRYRSKFIAMETVSTSQEKYYTRKLQARFAWDIVYIRRIRSHIMEELDELQSNLNHSNTMPLGLQSRMSLLLKLQSGLRENLLSLPSAMNTASYSQPSTATLESVRGKESIEDIENKIRNSVLHEVQSMFQSQIDELRNEMKAKDSLIEKLLAEISK